MMALFPNAEKVRGIIDSECDPVVRSLMLLVYGEFLSSVIAGKKPDGAVDLEYVFLALREAFRRKGAMANALNGDYGVLTDAFEWTRDD